jgi:hypothetical protein
MALHHIDEPHVAALLQKQLDRCDLNLAALPAMDLQEAPPANPTEADWNGTLGMHLPSRVTLAPL